MYQMKLEQFVWKICWTAQKSLIVPVIEFSLFLLVIQHYFNSVLYLCFQGWIE